MKKYKLFFVLVVAPLFLGGCFSKVSTPQKNTDIFDSAVASRNEVICDHIKEDGLSSQCKLEVARQRDSDLFNRAVSTGDPHACDNLSSENAKSKCLAIVSPPTPSAAPVALPTGESEAFDKALAERSEALCNGISDPLFAQRCRSAVLGLKDSDLLNEAVEKKDPTLCERLSTPEAKAKCVEVVKNSQAEVTDQ